jgi:hypothetical protein
MTSISPPGYKVRCRCLDVKSPLVDLVSSQTLDKIFNIVIDEVYPRRFSVAVYGLEVNDGEASLAEAITVLGVVASGFFLRYCCIKRDLRYNG